MKRTLYSVDQKAKLEILKMYISKCSLSPNSVANYTDFNRIEECLDELFPEKAPMCLLDISDPTEFSEVYKLLKKQKTFTDYNKKGNGQYTCALDLYQTFLIAKKFAFLYQPQSVVSISDIDLKDKPIQQIFYGAPGTGKSHTVDGVCEKYKHYRTTFHPDSDYSTFVGCYKPTKDEESNEVFGLIKLQELYKDFHESGQSRPIYRFIGKYAKSFLKLSQAEAQSIFESYTTQSVVTAEVPKALACIEGIDVSDKGSISYEFTPQAFTSAYLEAWKCYANGEPVFLVIEEINRGNCAQIFGDLFQLLDRNEQGLSTYPIKPDTDLGKYIETKGGLNVSGVILKGKDISEDINTGKSLVLPPNLYIWATMNTSDQSLFPIDSAFKRRWDWKFVKITEGVEKDDQGKIVFEKDENGDIKNDENGKPIKKKLGWQIKLSDEKTQDWWKFIQKVNEIIASMTSSADKQLGYFFCKPDLDKTTISAETFVSKVIFYLWNDVFKDFGFEDASLFRYKVNDKEEKDLTFPDFYDEDGEMVDTTRLTDFVDKVMNWKKTKEDND